MSPGWRGGRYAARMPEQSGLPVPPRASFEPTLPVDPNLINLHDYERVAAERLAPGPLAYFTGGAGDEVTLRDNRAAFARHLGISPTRWNNIERRTPLTTTATA